VSTFRLLVMSGRSEHLGDDAFAFVSLVNRDAMLCNDEVQTKECPHNAQRMDFPFRTKLSHNIIIGFDGCTSAQEIVSCSSKNDWMSIDNTRVNP
jgi:hypothetical protein